MKEENVIKTPQKLYSQPEYINISFLSCFFRCPSHLHPASPDCVARLTTALWSLVKHARMPKKLGNNVVTCWHIHILLFSFLGWITALKFTHIYMHKIYTYCLMNNQKMNLCVTLLEGSLPITISSLCPSQLQAHPALPVLVCLSCCNKWQRLGGLNNAHLFLTVMETESLRFGCQHDWVLVRAPFLPCRQLPSHCILIWKREGEEGKLFGVSSYKPIIRVPHS